MQGPGARLMGLGVFGEACSKQYEFICIGRVGSSGGGWIAGRETDLEKGEKTQPQTPATANSSGRRFIYQINFRDERSGSADHDFSGFDEGYGGVAGLEGEFADGVGGDDGGDALIADGEDDLGEQALDDDFNDGA